MLFAAIAMSVLTVGAAGMVGLGHGLDDRTTEPEPAARPAE